MCAASAIALYVIGGGLEVAGIWFVVAELKNNRERAIDVARISIPHVGPDPLRHSPKSPSWTIQGAIDEDRELAPQRAQAETSRKLRTALIDMLTGNERVQVWGVRLLIAGVITATAGNILASACAS